MCLLRDGAIEQQGSPLDLFERPSSSFVAGFLGSPKMNFIKATLNKNGVTLADGNTLALPGHTSSTERAVFLGLRPQHIALAGKTVAKGHARVPVTIELVQPTGSRVQVTLPFGGTSVIAELAAHDVSRPGEKVHVDIDLTRAIVIDAATEQVIQENP